MTIHSRNNISDLENKYKLIAAVYLAGLEKQDELYEFLTHFDYEFVDKLHKACEITLYEENFKNEE